MPQKNSSIYCFACIGLSIFPFRKEWVAARCVCVSSDDKHRIKWTQAFNIIATSTPTWTVEAWHLKMAGWLFFKFISLLKIDANLLAMYECFYISVIGSTSSSACVVTLIDNWYHNTANNSIVSVRNPLRQRKTIFISLGHQLLNWRIVVI